MVPRLIPDGLAKCRRCRFTYVKAALRVVDGATCAPCLGMEPRDRLTERLMAKELQCAVAAVAPEGA